MDDVIFWKHLPDADGIRPLVRFYHSPYTVAEVATRLQKLSKQVGCDPEDPLSPWAFTGQLGQEDDGFFVVQDKSGRPGGNVAPHTVLEILGKPASRKHPGLDVEALQQALMRAIRGVGSF
jgi:hypothetical protein